MEKIEFKNLAWPRGLNLEALAELLPEDVLRAFIAAHLKLQRKERRIILPSLACAKKVLAHRIWSDILSGKTSWEKEKKSLQEEFGSLAILEITKKKVKKLFDQREKEIVKENKL